MSDSAAIFSDVFKLQAEGVMDTLNCDANVISTNIARARAKKLWVLAHKYNAIAGLDCDETLIRLQLAKFDEGPHGDKQMLYRDVEFKGWEA